MKRTLLVFLSCLAGINCLFARVDLLLVPPVEAVQAESPTVLTLYLNNPTGHDEPFDLPREITAEYVGSIGPRHTRLVPVEPQPARRVVGARSRQIVHLRVTAPLNAGAGFVSLRLTDPASNAIMFEIAPSPNQMIAESHTRPPSAVARRHSPVSPDQQIDLTSDLENMRRHISAYDPIYFVVGSRDRLNARFQFSFKYRVFEPAPITATFHERLLREIYGAYTQTSIWDLESFSKPFYDSSYQPTAFLLHEFHNFPTEDSLLTLQVGAQHESNGRGESGVPGQPGSGSRSINSFYFAPKLRWTGETGLFFELGARASTYVGIDENPTLPRYRGYVEVNLRGGYDRGFQLSTHVRGHPRGHGSVEFNASWPAIETPFLKLIVPRSLGGYALIQYFNGYGESLLDYDVRRRDQLRFGIMLAR